MVHKDKNIRTLYVRNYHKARRYIFQNKVRKYKESIGKCELCGWNKHIVILQFHHLDKNRKRFKFNTGHLGSYSWKSIEDEIKKCKLVCPNCHNWIHYKEKDSFRTVAKKFMLERKARVA
jgi:hypothetical protein